MKIATIEYIDCYRQKETMQSGLVVMRVEFELDEKAPLETTVFCQVSHSLTIL